MKIRVRLWLMVTSFLPVNRREDSPFQDDSGYILDHNLTLWLQKVVC